VQRVSGCRRLLLVVTFFLFWRLSHLCQNAQCFREEVTPNVLPLLFEPELSRFILRLKFRLGQRNQKHIKGMLGAVAAKLMQLAIKMLIERVRAIDADDNLVTNRTRFIKGCGSVVEEIDEIGALLLFLFKCFPYFIDCFVSDSSGTALYFGVKRSLGLCSRMILNRCSLSYHCINRRSGLFSQGSFRRRGCSLSLLLLLQAVAFGSLPEILISKRLVNPLAMQQPPEIFNWTDSLLIVGDAEDFIELRSKLHFGAPVVSVGLEQRIDS
jgi:hypothetical protein